MTTHDDDDTATCAGCHSDVYMADMEWQAGHDEWLCQWCVADLNRMG